MRYNDKECQVLTIRDITTQRRLEKVQEQNEMLHLVTSSVSHDLMTPIQCIISFANKILTELKSGKTRHKANLIRSAGKLLLN